NTNGAFPCNGIFHIKSSQPMAEPETPRFCVVSHHAKLCFDRGIQLVEQMRVDADAGGDGEVAPRGLAIEAQVFNLSQRDAARRGSKRTSSSLGRGARQSEIVGERVRRAHG